MPLDRENEEHASRASPTRRAPRQKGREGARALAMVRELPRAFESGRKKGYKDPRCVR